MSKINLCSKDASLVTMVAHLQDNWGATIPKHVTITEENMLGIISQLQEELQEYLDVIDSLKKNDLDKASKQLRDVSVDMIFFILQEVVKVGISDKFLEDFYKIYLNNMMKPCETEELAIETANYYTNKGEPCYVQYVEKHKHWMVRRVEDNKVKKPLGFKEVEL